MPITPPFTPTHPPPTTPCYVWPDTTPHALPGPCPAAPPPQNSHSTHTKTPLSTTPLSCFSPSFLPGTTLSINPRLHLNPCPSSPSPPHREIIPPTSTPLPHLHSHHHPTITPPPHTHTTITTPRTTHPHPPPMCGGGGMGPPGPIIGGPAATAAAAETGGHAEAHVERQKVLTHMRSQVVTVARFAMIAGFAPGPALRPTPSFWMCGELGLCTAPPLLHSPGSTSRGLEPMFILGAWRCCCCS